MIKNTGKYDKTKSYQQNLSLLSAAALQNVYINNVPIYLNIRDNRERTLVAKCKAPSHGYPLVARRKW